MVQDAYGFSIDSVAEGSSQTVMQRMLEVTPLEVLLLPL